MFYHNFKYSLKTLLKNKNLLFWTFAFPIILGIFFNMAFKDIESSEKLKVIDIAVIDDDNFKRDYIFNEALEELSSGENKLFNIEYTDLSKAKELLDSNKIKGYLSFGNDDVNIYVLNSGVDETIIRYVTDEINNSKQIIGDILKKEKMDASNKIIEYNYSEILNSINKDTVKLNDISNSNLSYTMIEYYTLIAMACLYGGMFSMFITNYKLANMNSVGKRTAISPIHKGKMLIGSFLASYIIQISGIFILFVFTVLILKVDYGNNLILVILLALIGSLAGLSLGVAVATLIKKNENTKTGVLIAITMLGCFLSGMMGITMKYVIDKNVPFINKINPASMITDGFYSLYYYSTFDRYIFNVISLLVFTIVMLTISYRGLRREKYDSI